MDNTALFRATVRTVKVRTVKSSTSKRKTTESNNNQDSAVKPSKSQHRHNHNEFCLKAKDLVHNITELRQFLLEHRRDYINSINALSVCARLTETQRDQIDAQSENTIQNAHRLLLALRAHTQHYEPLQPPQISAHENALIEIIERYMKAVSRMHMEQKAIRVKKATDMKRMSRLSELLKGSDFAREKRLRPFRQTLSLPEVQQDTQASTSFNDEIFANSPPSVDDDHDVKPERSANIDEPQKVLNNSSTSSILRQRNAKNKKAATTAAGGGDGQVKRKSVHFNDADDQLTMDENEREILTAENAQLYARYNSTVNELDLLSGKVTEIGRLQSIFSEHVLSQERVIDSISTTAIHSTEDIVYGNEQIREAMKRKSDMRVWVIFVLLVLTFTLLFLDWYNP